MKIAILISGGGSTSEAIIKSSLAGRLKGKIFPAIVISSKPDAGGVQKALALKMPVEVIKKEDYKDEDSFGRTIIKVAQKYQVQLISQNGWLPLTPKNVIEAYPQKIINQHPGPLDPGRPDFGGTGMYGARVICARIIYCMLVGENKPWTEAITHFVTEEYDRGALIRIKRLDFTVLNKNVYITTIEQDEDLQNYIINKTIEVQKMLLPLEHENVIETLLDFAKGEVPLYNREKPLIPAENTHILIQAKGLAVKLFPNG